MRLYLEIVSEFSSINPGLVWLVRPNGPVSVGPKRDLSKCDFCRCHGAYISVVAPLNCQLAVCHGLCET